jgi:hypothetical protein
MSQSSKEPLKPREAVTESYNAILVVIEGNEDTTRRPRRPNIPYTPPPPPEKNLPEEPPKDNGQP